MLLQQTYHCAHCDYITDHKAKYDRHCKSLKHQISVNGIACCGLFYCNKYQWVNHKKSKKHNQYKHEQSQQRQSQQQPTKNDFLGEVEKV